MTPTPAPSPYPFVTDACRGVPRPAPLCIHADFYADRTGRVALGSEVRTRLAVRALRRAGRIGLLAEDAPVVHVTLPSPLPPIPAHLAAMAMEGR